MFRTYIATLSHQKYTIFDEKTKQYYPRERAVQVIFTVMPTEENVKIIKETLFPENAVLTSDNEGRNLINAICSISPRGMAEMHMFWAITAQLQEFELQGFFTLERMMFDEGQSSNVYTIGKTSIEPVTRECDDNPDSIM